MNKLKPIGYIFHGLLYGLIFICLSFLQNAYATENITIEQITVDRSDTPFFLDNKGNVWAYQKPLINEKLIQLSGLKNIVHLAPYVAVDRDGYVYTWGYSVTGDKRNGFKNSIFVDYTPSIKVDGLKNIIYVAYNAGHFAAIDQFGHIFHWYASARTQEQNRYSSSFAWQLINWDGTNEMDYSTMRMIASDKEAIKIVINFRGILALNKDGSVYGWGISPTGQEIVSNEPLSDKVDFNISESYKVTDISLNQYHSAFISEGKAHFYGGCDLGGKDYNNRLWSGGAVMDYVMPLEHLKSLSLSVDDNKIEDVFLDEDGRLWKMFAPPPININPKDNRLCGFGHHLYNTLHKVLYRGIDNGMIKFKQVVVNGKVSDFSKHGIYALAENGSVWTVYDEYLIELEMVER